MGEKTQKECEKPKLIIGLISHKYIDTYLHVTMKKLSHNTKFVTPVTINCNKRSPYSKMNIFKVTILIYIYIYRINTLYLSHRKGKGITRRQAKKTLNKKWQKMTEGH